MFASPSSAPLSRKVIAMTDKSAREIITEWLVDIGDGPADEEVAARMLIERFAESGLKVVGRIPTEAMIEPIRDRWTRLYPLDAITNWTRMWDAASNPKEEGK